jgi:Family of unknown function (DUF6166)
VKVYKGMRQGCVAAVTVNGRPLNPRLDLWNHSPTGFEWGYGGSGPAQLAVAILADYLGKDNEAVLLHQEFKRVVIAQLPRRTWQLTSSQIAIWLATLRSDVLREQYHSATPKAVMRLGHLVITANAQASLPESDVTRGIQRHQAGDWGEISKEDRAANDQALIAGTRIVSAYQSTIGLRFWIITEADRSVTTVLLPEDY